MRYIELKSCYFAHYSTTTTCTTRTAFDVLQEIFFSPGPIIYACAFCHVPVSISIYQNNMTTIVWLLLFDRIYCTSKSRSVVYVQNGLRWYKQHTYAPTLSLSLSITPTLIDIYILYSITIWWECRSRKSCLDCISYTYGFYTHV